MKITFVSPPLNMSGGTRVIAIYAKYLQEFGHEVLVVSPSRPAKGLLSRILQRLGLPQPAARDQGSSHLDGQGIPQRILKTCRPVTARDVPDADVIIATWWLTAEWVAAMPASKGEKVYFVQHYEVFDYLPKPRVEATYRLGMKMIVVAKWLVAAIATDEETRKRISIVPNAIDRAVFNAPERAKQPQPTIGTLFSETEFKGFDTTLRVLAEVRKSIPDLRVISFGSTPPIKYQGRLEGIALAINPSQSAISDAYARCDVWLSCSRSEGFNLTAMEAMGCRTPVVSTRTGWPEEAVRSGINGALAEVDDVAALARELVTILRLPPPEWKRLSDGALATVFTSGWEASARMFEAALPRAGGTAA
jgi:glycosyltransferase involved in cell wall biosynthesis